MANSDPLDEFGARKRYEFEKIGSYGRFQTRGAFPLDYVMTSFSMSELPKLSLARDVQPKDSDINFELLMQRDIDERRVVRDLEPYLSPQIVADSEGISRSRAVFFPPLLAAIVPVRERRMLSVYSDERRKFEGNRVIREWSGMFKIEHRVSEDSRLLLPELQGYYEGAKVDLEPSKIGLEIDDEALQGVKLVIIDGQHRLFALKELLKRTPAVLEGLTVPVCLVFPPNATEAASNVEKDILLPRVTDVFRDLFVDVNSTMETVSGHFNILLSNDNMGDVICREFCQHTIDKNGIDALATIEWNTRSDKEAKIIRKAYSLTSIGPLHLAFSENLGRNGDLPLLKYFLGLDEVEDKLYPEFSGREEDDIKREFPEVEWGQFSFTQKPVIEKQIEKYVLPVLDEVYFGVDQFKTKLDIFSEQIALLRAKSKEELYDSYEAREVSEALTLYKPLGTDKAVQKRFKKFDSELELLIGETVNPILGYAIFQRAMWMAYFRLLGKVGNATRISPVRIASGFRTILNYALDSELGVFDFDRRYMQHAVVDVDKIKPKKSTRKPLSGLILGFLCREEIANEVAEGIFDGISSDSYKEQIEKLLNEIGRSSVREVMGYFKSEYSKNFRKRFRVDRELEQKEKQELIAAEERQASLERQLESRDITEEQFEPVFDLAVEKYVDSAVRSAAKELRRVLKIDIEILAEHDDDDESIE